ncbi:MAG: multicopper oxidase domain-containing protein, partial [Candidatus Marinimicrobia bacterium]|nr:multicopper oxidase domain-containing protein [Candidatus Neomarinimicrobiota bacterium]
MNRRDFLTKAGIIAGGGLIGGTLVHQAISRFGSVDAARAQGLDPLNPDAFRNPLPVPGRDGFLGSFEPNGEPFEISTIPADRQITGGTADFMNLYRIEQNGKTWYNPVLRVRNGEQFRMTLNNDLTQPTIIHWHGMHVDWKNDGHPSDVVETGDSYQYDFQIRNRGGMYWYHPHPHGMTGAQVAKGMAGFLLVEDENDDRLRDALDLEFGVTELPLVIQDRKLLENGDVLYNPNPMEAFLGYHGDTIFSNYTAGASLDVDNRIYRLRILNGSNSRAYGLAFTDGSRRLPFQVIGGDAGLLEQPHRAEAVYLSAGERLDILMDFSQVSTGETVFLESLEFNPMLQPMGGGMMGGRDGGGMGGMMGGQRGRMGGNDEGRGMMGGQGGMMGRMMGGMALEPGAHFYVQRFHVTGDVSYDKTVPERLSQVPTVDTAGARTRPFELTHQMMQWLINGRQFQMLQVVEEVQQGDTEIWEIRNSQSSQPHPMHIHGFQFSVLERINSPGQVSALAVDGSGRQVNDLGAKDTVLVWPGETVRIAVDFSHDFSGEQLYLFHCHMLEHSDNGMMINYKVV